MAILDDYDGGVWSFNATFRPTGGRVPSPPAGAPAAVPGAAVVTVEQRVTALARLPIPMLPALDRPVSVRGIDAVVDPTTGMLLSGGRGAGAGTYSVTSRAPTMSLAAVPPGDGVGTPAGLTTSATYGRPGPAPGLASGIGDGAAFPVLDHRAPPRPHRGVSASRHHQPAHQRKAGRPHTPLTCVHAIYHGERQRVAPVQVHCGACARRHQA